jgi:hypothetical protein
MFASRTLTRAVAVPLPVSVPADAGWQRISQLCLALQCVLVVTSVALYRATDIEVRWSSDAGFVALVGALLTAWIALVAAPGDSLPRRRVAEGLAAGILFLSLIQITAPMQYGALALGRPFIDGWLNSVDHRLGVDVAQVTAWTGQFPWLVRVLNATYNTLAAQLLIPLVLLPLAGDREALWEYLWHLHVSLAGALLCLALWPAICPFTFLHYDPLVPPALVQHLATQIADLHAGRFHVVALQDMQGLISFPSFHAAAAVAVTWAVRRQRIWIWLPVALINVGLVSATVLLGIHYVTDLAGTVVLLGVSLVLYRTVTGSPEKH